MKDKSADIIKINLDPTLFKSGVKFNLREKYDNVVAYINSFQSPLDQMKGEITLNKDDDHEIGRSKTYILTEGLEKLYNDMHTVLEVLERVKEGTKKSPATVTELKNMKALLDISELLESIAERFPKNYSYFKELATFPQSITKTNVVEVLSNLIADLPSTSIAVNRPPVITLEVVREGLEQLGISNPAQRDAVIFTVLQGRLASPFLGAIMASMVQVIATNSNPKLAYDQFNPKESHLEVTYNKKTKQAVILCMFDLWFKAVDDDKNPLQYAKAVSETIVNEDKTVIFKENYVIIEKKIIERNKKLATFPQALEEECNAIGIKAQSESPSQLSEIKEDVNIPTAIPAASKDNDSLELLSINNESHRDELVIRKETLLTKLKNFIVNNPWKTTAIILGTVGLIIGVALVASGVGSPIGLLLATAGAKVTLGPALSAVVDLALTTVIGPLMTGIAKVLQLGFDFIKSKLSHRTAPDMKESAFVSNREEPTSEIESEAIVPQNTAVITKALTNAENNNNEMTIQDAIEFFVADEKVINHPMTTSRGPALMSEYTFTPIGVIAKPTETLKKPLVRASTFLKKDATSYEDSKSFNNLLSDSALEFQGLFQEEELKPKSEPQKPRLNLRLRQMFKFGSSDSEKVEDLSKKPFVIEKIKSNSNNRLK